MEHARTVDWSDRKWSGGQATTVVEDATLGRLARWLILWGGAKRMPGGAWPFHPVVALCLGCPGVCPCVCV